MVQSFFVTDFACWLLWYPHTVQGTVACDVAAIPFFRDALAGDATFAVVPFGGLAVAERGFPVLREPAPAALPA